MRHLATIIFICVRLNCYSQNLFDTIPQAQYAAIGVSQYKDAPIANGYIQSQQNFRKNNFPKAIQELLLTKVKLTDTLWIVEEFNDGCYTCQSFRTKILYKDKLFVIKQSNNTVSLDTIKFSQYKNKSDFVTSQHEIFEVKERINKNKSWTSNALMYGEDGCNDGSHTFLTMILPNRTTQSLYVRCWYDWYGKKID